MTTPFPIVEKSKSPATMIVALAKKDYAAWLKKQPLPIRHWLDANGFAADAGKYCPVPGKDGSIAKIVCGTGDEPNLWSLAHLPGNLPAGTYALENSVAPTMATQWALGWALACYTFRKYKAAPTLPSPASGRGNKFVHLVAPKGCDADYVRAMAGAVNWARDMVNTPASDMHPEALAEEAAAFAQAHKAQVRVIKGEALLKANYPTIYAVGKAASVPPHLVDIHFIRKGAPKITLVGKGVTFDSGGLDIKPSGGMKLMKKDMGGAAAVLALAKVIVETNIPVQLRVLLPIVENAISGNAMRPLDIVKTRKGITVEIGNTDAEGRLILCDALTEADNETPDLLIDCATLTGAARVALGSDIPAFFTADDALADDLMTHSRSQSDPLWRLPLWKPYRSMLDSQAADLSNDPDSSYGGAITAALYLQEFVSKTPSWLHIDMMAWNLKDRPGRPAGGEAMAIRALYAMIRKRYGR